MLNNEIEKAFKKELKVAKVNVEDYSRINLDGKEMEVMKRTCYLNLKRKINHTVGLRISKYFEDLEDKSRQSISLKNY